MATTPTEALSAVYMLGQRDVAENQPARTVAEIRGRVGIAEGDLPQTAIENMYLHGRAGTAPEAINLRRAPADGD